MTTTSHSEARQYDAKFYSNPSDILDRIANVKAQTTDKAEAKTNSLPSNDDIEKLFEAITGRKISPVAKAMAASITEQSDLIATVMFTLDVMEKHKVAVHPVTQSNGDGSLTVTGMAVHFPPRMIERLAGANFAEGIKRAESHGIRFVKDTNPERHAAVSEDATIYPLDEFLRLARVWAGDISAGKRDGEIRVNVLENRHGDHLLMF